MMKKKMLQKLCLDVYKRQGKCHTQKEYFIRAILISVLGYLFAGMFNDSMVVTAPVFWCLLGLGAGGMGDRVRNTIS